MLRQLVLFSIAEKSNNFSMLVQHKHIHSQKKYYYYSYIGSYLKAVRSIAEICLFTEVVKPQLQPEVANHCLYYTVQTVLNFAAGSFCCKITLIWLGSSLSVLK